jgi:hypothetical protein
VNCGGMFDRAAQLLAFAFRFFLDGSLEYLHIVGDVLDDGGGVIPKNPSRQSCADAESFRKLLPFTIWSPLARMIQRDAIQFFLQRSADLVERSVV